MGFFTSNNEKMELLKKAQDNLEASQKNIEAMLSKDVLSPEVTLPEYSDEDKRRAAYALNLCMVSVSQIIDYDDIYILEQEYDAILNNLNLEVMPKDEALLDILKQLLNVITFFRIQEGDKVFIEREYQQRMKDAIWSAVPNFGVLLTSGSIVSGALCLASQVGIGYMNYRKEKAKVKLEHEKQHWQLQRSAMEQFNGLRRELFDTAWRLADKYNFPDEYRITERQIARYNEIILDTNYLRRYERLDYIKDKFAAYPPFLYYLGNAANMVSQDDKSYDIEVRSKFRALAIQHFQSFLDQTEKNLMREDQLQASCALEYFDILLDSGNRDVDFLASLLMRAINATNSLDVLEIAAFSFGKIGRIDEASKIFRMLVNEDYNTIVNAQILTYIYVSQYLRNDNKDALESYKTLGVGLNKNLLFPLPAPGVQEKSELSVLNSTFISLQQDRIRQKYSSVLYDLCQKYMIEFNKSIPAPDKEVDNPNWYYRDDSYAKSVRQNDIDVIFMNDNKAADYISKLAGSHFDQKMIDVLNNVFAAMLKLPCMRNNPTLNNEIKHAIENDVISAQPIFNNLLTKIGSRSFTANDIPTLFKLDLQFFTRKAFELLTSALQDYISNAQNMDTIAKMESDLKAFCASEQLTYPDSDDYLTDTSCATPQIDERPFSISLLGDRAKEEMKRVEKSFEMLKTIVQFASRILVDGASDIEFYTKDDGKFAAYLGRHKDVDQDKTLAIINDTSISDEDWILTSDGMYRYKSLLFWNFKQNRETVAYHDIKFSTDRKQSLQIGKYLCSDNKRINLKELSRLVQSLAEIEAKHKGAASKL